MNGKFAFANGSVVYYANLAMAASGLGVPSIAISRSRDDGASWMAPISASSSSDNPVDFNDKINVWADANSSSPFFGNAYASWTLSRAPATVAVKLELARQEKYSQGLVTHEGGQIVFTR